MSVAIVIMTDVWLFTCILYVALFFNYWTVATKLANAYRLKTAWANFTWSTCHFTKTWEWATSNKM